MAYMYLVYSCIGTVRIILDIQNRGNTAENWIECYDRDLRKGLLGKSPH